MSREPKKYAAGVIPYEERHRSRVCEDAFDVAYDRARAAGLSHREATRLAQDARQAAGEAYNRGRF